MIIFNLKCNNCEYSFEGWFDTSNEYLRQKKKNLINCPSCNSSSIEKGLMTPNLNKKSNSKINKKKKSVASNISKLRKIIEKDFDYVGDKFTEEAKRMKYGETQERSIYGEATLDQTKELIEEEIDVLPLPFSTKKTN
tara:strand:+ start:616 stop:1029 length:414 start_codon:yes stop_codon:yes gene_type:complete